MTSRQLKTEIQNTLDKIPENALQDILDYLKAIQSTTKEQVELSRNLKKLLTEDKELLQKLAQ